MNADDQGRNLAEAVTGPDGRRYPLHRPVHGGYPDPRCACAGTGYVVGEGGAVVPCPEHLLAARDPRGEAPRVDWEALAGRALAELQIATNELKRLRLHMPVDALIEYDRRYHGDA